MLKMIRYREHVDCEQDGVPWSRVVPGLGLCPCGAEVELDRFTNTCDCGRDYNSAGQELAPREQWGEETGESVADILSVDMKSTDELLGGNE